MKDTRLWTLEFINMGCSNLFFFMSQYILVAALPIFIMDDMGGGEWEAGLAMTFFQIGTVACRPVAGRLIDAFNKRKMLAAASILFFLIMLGFNFAHSLHYILGLRLVHGIIFAIGTTTSATLAALLLPASRKGEGIGYFAVSGNMAMVIGPLAGLLIIHQLGSSALFIFLTVMAMATILVSMSKKLPDSVEQPSPVKRKGWSINDFVEKKALPMAVLGGLVFFAYGGVLTFIPMYAKTLGMEASTSLFFMVFALVIIITRPLVGYVFDRQGPDYTVYPGFFFFAAGFLLFSRAEGLTGFMVSAAVLGTGFGALSPAFQTLAVQAASNERAGVATATYFWSLDISVGLAAACLGGVAKNWGYPFMYGTVSVAAVVVAVLFYFFWARNRQKKVASSLIVKK